MTGSPASQDVQMIRALGSQVFRQPATSLLVDIRGAPHAVEVVTLPFYRRPQ
jgi:hypothetical protein